LKLEIRSLRWIPFSLSTDQKKNRVQAAHEMLTILRKEKATGYENIVTGDETWLDFDYPIKSMWLEKEDSRPEAPTLKVGRGKVMVVIFWSTTGFHIIFPVEKGTTVTSQVFIKHVLDPLDKDYREGSEPTQKFYLHMDNCRVHTSKLCTQFLSSSCFIKMPHPPYSPDIAPSDFFLFGDVKRQLMGKHFSSAEELMAALEEILEMYTSTTLISVMDEWVTRLEAIIDAKGEYY
jgi:hypothetical protein